MASWLHPEKKSNQNQVPPLQQKSRIPVRVTRLSREGNRRPSSENGAYNKAQLERISVSKLQNKRPSRIPIPMDDRKDKVKVEVNLSENVKTTREEKFLGKNSVTGINLQETQEKHGKKRAISVTSTTAKYGSYIRAKKTKPKVRRRVPRQPSPIETEPKQVNLNKVCNDEKEPREERSANEVSSLVRTVEVTPDFECNVAPVHEEELHMGTEADFSDSGFSYDFERQSKSTDEKAIPNVLAWLRKEYRERDEIDDNIVKDDNAVMSAAQNNKHEPEFDSDSKMDVDECNDLTRYKRSVPGVVNVSGYLFPQELSKALETAKPESKKKCTSQSEEKFPEEEPKLHKENIEMEFEQLKRENTELETQMSVMIEELEKYRKKIETLQVDLDESKVEVKRLQFKEEYKERELANLKRDLQSKEQKWKQGNEHVEKVMADIGDLWDDVDYMQESLKNSQERNEILTFEVDELTIMMQEMKREYWMEHSRGGCGHLREEVELLNGSLELKEQRVVVLESQIDAFQAERKELLNSVGYLEESLKNSQEKNEDLTFEVDELTIMMQEMRREYRMEHSRGGCGHLREEVELLNGSLELKEQRVVLLESQIDAFQAERKELLNSVGYLEESLKNSQEKNEDLTFEVDELTIMMQEMRREYRMEHSRGGCGHLREEVELLNGSLELREQRVVVLQSQIDAFQAERKELLNSVGYLEESLKNSQEKNEDLTFEVDELTIMMQEMKREYWMEHNRGGCGHLREEVVLLNGSLELKEQRIVLLESQVDAFKAERSSFTNAAQSMEREMEILNNEKATTKTQFHERNRETSKIISDLQDEIAKLQKEKSTLSSELSKESGEDNQLCEITCEKSWITRKLEDHITRLRRENCSLTARVSKAYEKDVQLIELKEKVEFNKHQLKNLTEAAKASLNNKEKEVEEANRIIKKQDETIKNLIEEIRQERCDRDRLEVQSEKIKELEAQLQRMEDIKRNTSADALVLEVRPESSEKEHLKKAMEAKECRSHRAKELHKRIGHLENQLRERDDLINATLTSLNNNKRSLMEANNTIDLLTEQLEREKSDKETLRRALEVYESNSFAKKEMTEKIEKLEEQLQEMDDLREKTPRSLREKERSLEEAHVEIKELTQQMALEKPDKKCFKRKIKARKGIANRLNLVQKGTKRDTQGKGSIMAHVGKRLKNLLRKQQEVKGKEISTGCVLEKSRDDLRSNLNYSDKEFSSMRRQLEDSKFENADLKQRLGEKDGKVRALETSTKQLQEDLQKTHKYLKEREVGLDDVNETLQLKCSLLTTLGAELCLRSKELTQTNKDKGLEITRIEANLGEVKKELDIATSIVEKQNEQCANFKTCAMRKTLDAEEMQNELRRLSTRLECAKSEKEKFQKALLTATARLENERFFAEKEQKAPHVKVNSSLKELNTKGKQFWDTKIDLQGAAVPLPALEDEKAEQEENLAAFQGKLLHELNLLEETQYVENEKESPLLLTIGSAEREMAKLTRENSRQFRTELLHNGFEKPSESPCEERTFSTLEIKRVKATPYKITFFDDGNCQGDTKHKWVNTSGMEKRFETSGDPHFNRTSTGAEVDHSTRNLSAHRSLNIVSVLHCNG